MSQIRLQQMKLHLILYERARDQRHVSLPYHMLAMTQEISFPRESFWKDPSSLQSFCLMNKQRKMITFDISFMIEALF